MWASIIAAIIAAAANYMGNREQAKAVNRATNNAMLNQKAYADKIRERAAERAQEYNTDARKEKQEAITEELAQDYTAQPTDAVSIAQDAARASGDVSSDYDEAKLASDSRVRNNIETFGKLLANVHGAKTLRQRENWLNADAANQIGVQQALMRSQNILDNYKIQNAQNAGQGWHTLGQLAGLASMATGFAGMASGAAGGATGAAAGSGAGTGFSGAGMGGALSSTSSNALNTGNILGGMTKNGLFNNSANLLPNLRF